MIRVTVKLFAALRERAGVSEVRLELPDKATVAHVWEWLKKEYPKLAGYRETIAFAVNHEYVDGSFRPHEGDEVALIPPVSGGAEGASEPWVGTVAIGPEAISVEALEAEVRDPGAGAVVSFAGSTRDFNAGRRVVELFYEAYLPMALRELHRLAEEAGRRFRITRIALRHRVGRVPIGEFSVAIAVSAPHRADAFDACRFAIDRIKEVVPIWKKEYFEGGEVWVGCQTSHPPLHLESSGSAPESAPREGSTER